MQEMKVRASVVAVTVEVPDELPMPVAASVTFRPKTVEEFDGVLEALGGVGAFSFPQDGGYWDSPAYNVDRSGGALIVLHPPPQQVAGVEATVRAHPFFREYAARAAVTP